MGSWEQGSAPALTCLDTTGSLFCPHGGEEEDGGVWLEGWGGYACRLKVRVGGLAMSVTERKQRKPEVTLLTLNVLKAGKLTFTQNNDGQGFRKGVCLFSGFWSAYTGCSFLLKRKLTCCGEYFIDT